MRAEKLRVEQGIKALEVRERTVGEEREDVAKRFCSSGG